MLHRLPLSNARMGMCHLKLHESSVKFTGMQVITLAGELLSKAEDLLKEGLTTIEVAEGYSKAAEKVRPHFSCHDTFLVYARIARPWIDAGLVRYAFDSWHMLPVHPDFRNSFSSMVSRPLQKLDFSNDVLPAHIIIPISSGVC